MVLREDIIPPRKQIWKTLSQVGSSVLDLLYPPLCRSCRKRIPEQDGRNFCDACWHQIKMIPEPTCLKCGAPMEFYLARGRNKKCPWCPIDVIHFDRAAAVTRYEGVLRDSIHWFKFRYKEGLKESLGRLMLEGFQGHYYSDHFDVIVPVPLHWYRQLQREFNQAALLARPVSEAAKIPLLEKGLIRKRRTRPQSNISSSQLDLRRKNIAGAFKVRDDFMGKSVLLIDDLFTSGSTVNECARVLKLVGAKRVCVLTLARAIARHS